MLEITAASLSRANRRIVHDVNLAVRPGSLLVLIGPNGAGKSTALRLLSGELESDEGSACLDGLALGHWHREALARRRAVLSQRVTLAFGFSVFDVVAMGRSPHPECGGAANRWIVRAALAAVDMLPFAARDYQTLSGGEQQRVQLARVLAQIWPDERRTSPCYLLLDEPVTGLDPAHQHAIISHAQCRARQGCGVLAVLHDLNLASQYADRVAIMRDGQIFHQGTPEEAFTAERIHAAFGVSSEISVHPRTHRPQLVMWAQQA
ncbi:MAG TPA: heme ABC transporter ATP-binding protein [Gammaproteobacteria bacterium]|nr:heme ABC transporter ATP-binding protein [Gammaproteobacteria bacterium]